MAMPLKSVPPRKLQDPYWKIQQFFFDVPTEKLSLNDLSETLHISKSKAKVVVTGLLQEGFLNREIISKLWRISCNQAHPYNMTRKIPYHVGLVYESNLVQAIQKTVSGVRAIILFGSYRKGDDIERSDLDLAAEVIGDDSPKIIDLGIISKLGYRENVPVHVHVFSRNNISMNVFANIANGIILEGFLEVRP